MDAPKFNRAAQFPPKCRIFSPTFCIFCKKINRQKKKQFPTGRLKFRGMDN